MRPVNLIPPEERRGGRGPSRTGTLPYVLLAALALGIAGVAGVVLTDNRITDREAEIATLEGELESTTAAAEQLSPYAEFAAMEGARTATVTSLARSRFDWERVLRELALVIPEDVWLTDLTATVTPEAGVEGGAEVALRGDVQGPALALVGCGASHEAVARFSRALEDIDGVTRVGLAKSERPVTDSSGGSGDTDCRTRDFISRFEVVAAFDEVPTPDAASAAPPAPASPAAGDGSGVAEAQAQEQAARGETADQVEDAGEATNLVPGVAR